MPHLGHAVPVRHLKTEALRTLRAMQAGRIPWSMGEGCLRLICLEVADILERNLLRLHGKPSAPAKFSVGRPSKYRKREKPAKPKRAYVRRQLMPPHLYREVEEHTLEPWLAEEGRSRDR
jgi:hypothetical protein